MKNRWIGCSGQKEHHVQMSCGKLELDFLVELKEEQCGWRAVSQEGVTEECDIMQKIEDFFQEGRRKQVCSPLLTGLLVPGGICQLFWATWKSMVDKSCFAGVVGTEARLEQSQV